MPFTSSIFACRYVKKNTTAIAGATHASFNRKTVEVVDPGPAGSPGTAMSAVTDREVTVTVYGLDHSELAALVESTAENVVIGYIGTTGNRKMTIKDVQFTTFPQEVQTPAKDAGGKTPIYAIAGRAKWGSADTFATMVVDAVDS